VSAGLFAAPGERADVAVAVVTFNSADHVGDLLDSLRGSSRSPTWSASTPTSCS
jgi:hypothetical protein